MNLFEARTMFKKFTQSELSKISGVNQGRISCIENGAKPSKNEMRKLEKALGAPLDWENN